MTGFTPKRFSTGCFICSASIALENCKTDECGNAVHEDCYVRKTVARFRMADVIRPSENWLSSTLARFQLRLREADHY